MPRTLYLYAACRIFAIASLMLAAMSEQAKACSAILIRVGDSSAVGKNYDWFESHGYLISYPPKLSKSGLVPGANPLRWTSRYASLAFGQHWLDHSIGGINENGLVVEMLLNAGMTEAPLHPDPKMNYINQAQFTQFLLDTVGRVSELKDFIPFNLQVVALQNTPSVHYFVTDKWGDTAVITSKQGQIQIQNATKAPVLTNSVYPQIPYQSMDPRWAMLNNARSKLESSREGVVDTTFNILQQAQLGSFNAPSNVFATQWQIVYVPTEKEIHFKGAGSAGFIIAGFNNSPTTVQFIDVKKVDSKSKLPIQFRNLEIKDLEILATEQSQRVNLGPYLPLLRDYYKSHYGQH